MNKKTLVYGVALLVVAAAVGVGSTLAHGFGRGFDQGQVELRISEKLEAGELTQEQADARLVLLEEKAARHTEKQAELAEFFGLSTEELQAELDGDKTIKEVAKAQGISAEELREYHKAQKLEYMTERLQQAVEAGKLTQDEVDEKLEQLESGEYDGHYKRGHGHDVGKGFGHKRDFHFNK